MLNFLTTTCGLSAAKAAKAAKHLAHLKSPSKPQSHGFDAPNLKRLISACPELLCCNPKLQHLLNLGFSQPQIASLAASNPSLLTLGLARSVEPRLKAWAAVFPSKTLMAKFFNRNPSVVGLSVEKKIVPILGLMRECGVTGGRLGLLLLSQRWFVFEDYEFLRERIRMVDELGVPRESGMYVRALVSVFQVKEVEFVAKKELLMSFGWTEEEFRTAFYRAPRVMGIREAELKKRMGFLVNEVGCSPSYLSRRPALLRYSLQKRVVPRYRVMEILKWKGVLKERDFYNVVCASEKMFKKRFLVPYQEQYPEILDFLTN